MERGSAGPVRRSVTAPRARQLATVFGLTPEGRARAVRLTDYAGSSDGSPPSGGRSRGEPGA